MNMAPEYLSTGFGELRSSCSRFREPCPAMWSIGGACLVGRTGGSFNVHLLMLEPLFLRCWKGYGGQSSIIGPGREKKVSVVGVPNPRLLLLGLRWSTARSSLSAS